MSTPKDKALAITKGRAVVRHDQDFYWVDADTEDGGTSIANTGTGKTAKGDAKLIADAHNTYHSCQMLPSEMLEKLREAEKTIADLEATCHQMAHTITTFDNPDPE